MQAGMGVRIGTFLILSVLAQGLARAEDTGTLAVTVSQHSQAPGLLFLRPEGATDKDSIVKLEARIAGLNTSLFVTTLPAGRYEILGTRLADTGVPNFDLSITNASMAPLVVDAAVVEIEAGRHADLGRIWSDTLGGNLRLMLRDAATLPNRMVDTDLPEGDAAAWISPIGALEAALVDRARDRNPGISVPREFRDGSWVTYASNGKVMAKPASGAWEVVASVEGDRVAAVAMLGPSDFMTAGEFGHLYRDGVIVGRLPAGIPRHLHCDGLPACIAMLQRGETFVLVHSSDVSTGEWAELLELEGGSSFWRGPIVVQASQVGDETIVFAGKEALTRVAVSTGAVEQQALDFRVDAPIVSAGRILVRGHYSDDAGRTWAETPDTRLRDGLVQYDAEGGAWAQSTDAGFNIITPILRRLPAGRTDWKDAGALPGQGEFRVGRFSPDMYFSSGGSLWVSDDEGTSWKPDQSLYELVMGE